MIQLYITPYIFEFQFFINDKNKLASFIVNLELDSPAIVYLELDSPALVNLELDSPALVNLELVKLALAAAASDLFLMQILSAGWSRAKRQDEYFDNLNPSLLVNI